MRHESAGIVHTHTHTHSIILIERKKVEDVIYFNKVIKK